MKPRFLTLKTHVFSTSIEKQWALRVVIYFFCNIFQVQGRFRPTRRFKNVAEK